MPVDAESMPQGSESGLTRWMAEDGGEEVGIPAGAFSSELDASLVLSGADEIDGEVSDDGHVFCSVPGS